LLTWPTMLHRHVDLICMAGCAVVLVALVLMMPGEVGPVRIALALPFVLFFPGYALTAVLFPKKGDLEPVERVALSFGLSLAVVPLIGLALNYSPWGIRLNSILGSLASLIVVAAAAAAYRRQVLLPEEAFVVPINEALAKWRRSSLMDRLLGLALVLTVVGLGVAVYTATSSRGGETFTEFYVLGPGGKIQGYPKQVAVGEEVTLTAGVINHEGRAASYRIEIRAGGETLSSIDLGELADEEKWEQPVSFTLWREGERQKVEFLLYKDLGTEPYRTLHLWVDVKAPAAAALPGPSPQDATTPALTPEAARAPAPRPALGAGPSPIIVSPDGGAYVYTVQPGDTLTSIAARFALGLDDILKANGMAEAGPIRAGQQLRIPGVAYTVRAGDTLEAIAAAYGVSVMAIIAANGIRDANSIYVGQVLFIPKAAP
jgi:uncharacterized membrane protein/LysM repeat protein